MCIEKIFIAQHLDRNDTDTVWRWIFLMCMCTFYKKAYILHEFKRLCFELASVLILRCKRTINIYIFSNWRVFDLSLACAGQSQLGSGSGFTCSSCAGAAEWEGSCNGPLVQSGWSHAWKSDPAESRTKGYKPHSYSTCTQDILHHPYTIGHIMCCI